MRRFLLFLSTCIIVAVVNAAPLSPAARSEIDGLMNRLEASACEFNRNGSWYTAREAKGHLLRKLKVLEDNGAVQTTEQFIELAASTSSSTGQPYSVRCPKDTPVPSRSWLLSQLHAMRAAVRARSAQ